MYERCSLVRAASLDGASSRQYLAVCGLTIALLLLLLLLLQSLGSQLPADVQAVLGAPGVRAAFAIWTTTPWTIPANLAVAVNADLDYCLVRAQVSRRAHRARTAARPCSCFGIC
jgi:hypothetical protein